MSILIVPPLLSSIILACPFAQQAPPSQAPDTALFDELIRKTSELRAFVAVYRVHAPRGDSESTIRILFRAPDDLKLEFDTELAMRIRSGVMDVRGSSPDGKSMFASVPMSESGADRHHRFASLVRSEFPAASKDWQTETECGAVLQMLISPSGKGNEENFQFTASYSCPRATVLGWLETWKSRKDERIEKEDRLVFKTSKGCEVELSTRTGFIEEVRKEKGGELFSFKLESLDLDPELDGTSFDLPAAESGAIDASDQFSGQWQNSITESQRRKFIKWISRGVSDRTLEWNADSRLGARKILEALHAEGLTLENHAWIERTRKWTEGYGTSLRGRLAKADESAREGIETEIGEQRDKLVESLQKMLEQRTSSLAIDETAVSDGKLRSDLEKVEGDAVQAAFEHAVQGPLLEAFDEHVQRAKSGG